MLLIIGTWNLELGIRFLPTPSRFTRHPSLSGQAGQGGAAASLRSKHPVRRGEREPVMSSNIGVDLTLEKLLLL